MRDTGTDRSACYLMKKSKNFEKKGADIELECLWGKPDRQTAMIFATFRWEPDFNAEKPFWR